jgi:photosystem II stability/assembly factor-like uncharacterized protein
MAARATVIPDLLHGPHTKGEAMPSSRRKITPIVLLSLPGGILLATAIWSAFGWPLSVWTFVVGLLGAGTVWALYARLRPRAKPTPEPPNITWQPQRSGIDEVFLLGVAFVDATRGWVVGGSGTILATTDGGETWSRQDSGSRAELNAVVFPDAAHGWAVGNDESGVGTILSTVDGGATWRQQATSASLLSGLAFPDTTHGWVVGGSGTILATTDGGETWAAQAAGSTASLLGVTFVDAVHGWAVGVDSPRGRGTILATADGGETWKAQRARTSGPLTAVAFPDAAHGWAVGEHGTILATDDGGETWSAQSPKSRGDRQYAPALHAVSFPDPSHGWAVGRDDLRECGLIFTTMDGGATWFKTPGRGNLFDVAFPDNTHGWAVGHGDDEEGGAETGLILVASEGHS